MNKFERIVYDLVKSSPWIKLAIRNAYQSTLDLLPNKPNILPDSASCKEGFYYGFHDTTPFSKDNYKVLANKLLKQELKMPKPEEPLSVGYFDFVNGQLKEYHEISKSYAWNYHKGCRLQWVADNRIIFNTAKDGKLCSEIVDIQSGKSTLLDRPIDTVSPCGRFAISFSYTRLEYCMSGYGYPYDDKEAYLDEVYPSQTGLYLVNIDENSSEMLYSIEELYNDLNGYNNKADFKHYVTHTEFSPCGKYISFMHRWASEKDKNLRFSRLLIYDIEKRNFKELPTNGMVSHYVWRDSKILVYCRVKDVDAHVEFDTVNDTHRIILPNILNSDGHQSYINDNEFVTDIYPDRYRMQKLFKVNMSNDSIELLASTRHPKKFQSSAKKGHTSCDYHPVCSADGKYVCFDAILNNTRSICVLPL